MPKRRIFACEQCGKIGAYRGTRFCSRSCRTSCLNRLDNPARREAAREKLSRAAKAKGYATRLSTAAARAKAIPKIADALRGRKQSEEHVRSRAAGWKHAYTVRGGMSEAHRQQLAALHERMRGENHPMWQGGTSTEREKEYRSEEYKSYRRSVLKRDDYTCQVCSKRGGRLDVHHCWIAYAQCKGPLEFLKYHPINGCTLCKPCHDRTKTCRPDLQQPELHQLPDDIRDFIRSQVGSEFQLPRIG